MGLFNSVMAGMNPRNGNSMKRQRLESQGVGECPEVLEVRQVLSAVTLQIGKMGVPAGANPPAANHSSSFTGTWNIAVHGNPSQTYLLTLSQTGNAVTGNISFGGSSRTVTGTANGNHLTLTLGATPPGTPITIVGGTLHVNMNHPGHFQGHFQIQGEAMLPQNFSISGALQNPTGTA